MTRFVPWLLVALCFVLGVASRSISDAFPVFVPALEHGFRREPQRGHDHLQLRAAGRRHLGPDQRLDRRSVRPARAHRDRHDRWRRSRRLAASQATALWHLYVTLGVMLGFGGAAVSGVLSASLLGRWFPTRRLGVALAVAWSASGVGTMLMIPLARAHDRDARAGVTPISSSRSSSAVFVPLLLVLPWRRIAARRARPGAAARRRRAPGRRWARRCATGRSGR